MSSTNQIYCLKCKKRTPTQNPAIMKHSNGRTSVQGICAVCGKTKSQFLAKNVNGAGFLSSLAGSIEKMFNLT